MFGFFKSPGNNLSNESNSKGTINPGRRTSSEPILITPDFDHPSSKDKYKDDFRDSGGLQSQTTEDLEKYAVYKAEETTKGVNNCLKIAEDIRSDATRTLDMLHQQGEQINRTHVMAVEMDKDLSRGEKLLNNLGGMFSMPWKPKKTKHIAGPMITPADNPSKQSENRKEQREKLGLAPTGNKGRSRSQTPPPEPTNALQKVEQEKAKQEDGLSDLSDILGDLKSMAVDMGSELDRQNKALDHLSDDVDELNSRVKGANQRARHLLSK
ncbi:PREDICTED: putative SNAP25 homologous protein SNAP30 [Tarenaya hassleriana]|uniref:putative SNAP25 homologous protein SNAP30 n=1 Tax=Tarenaya hassleriana TaxID=28532 RepID=UPI00053C4A83|nr:PREDICTED: putative SNAP25 homologous protein SNAP30 [Tarenaya hassleriana]XP_010523485.1 PREDICTED: putative SNAP25 homologous protein SNAP30 [Tarenaya hassleriana]